MYVCMYVCMYVGMYKRLGPRGFCLTSALALTLMRAIPCRGLFPAPPAPKRTLMIMFLTVTLVTAAPPAIQMILTPTRRNLWSSSEALQFPAGISSRPGNQPGLNGSVDRCFSDSAAHIWNHTTRLPETTSVALCSDSAGFVEQLMGLAGQNWSSWSGLDWRNLWRRMSALTCNSWRPCWMGPCFRTTWAGFLPLGCRTVEFLAPPSRCWCSNSKPCYRGALCAASAFRRLTCLPWSSWTSAPMPCIRNWSSPSGPCLAITSNMIFSNGSFGMPAKREMEFLALEQQPLRRPPVQKTMVAPLQQLLLVGLEHFSMGRPGPNSGGMGTRHYAGRRLPCPELAFQISSIVLGSCPHADVRVGGNFSRSPPEADLLSYALYSFEAKLHDSSGPFWSSFQREAPGTRHKHAVSRTDELSFTLQVAPAPSAASRLFRRSMLVDAAHALPLVRAQEVIQISLFLLIGFAVGCAVIGRRVPLWGRHTVRVCPGCYRRRWSRRPRLRARHVAGAQHCTTSPAVHRPWTPAKHPRPVSFTRPRLPRLLILLVGFAVCSPSTFPW